MDNNNKKIVEQFLKDSGSHVKMKLTIDKYDSLIGAIEKQYITKINKEVLEMITEGISPEARDDLNAKLLYHGYWYDSSQYMYILIRRTEEGTLCEKTTQY